MKISYQWLKDYVPVDVRAEEFAHKLTMAGLEVENIETVNGDSVFEIEVTPNRPDCLNMIGIAREVSAIFNQPKKFPASNALSFPSSECDITIEDKEGCFRYMGTIIRNVTIKKAGNVMIERLAAIGMRPINNIVDVTNFCLMENGQPLHAFDYDKLIGGKILVRRAKKGEKIVTLDDVERELDPSILVIADAERPVAIAGVMGGKATEVTDATKNILLESAYFDPILIRRASRKLGLSSDSSYRFERGVDFEGVKNGAYRAMDLILQEAGGEISHHKDVRVRDSLGEKRTILISCAQVNHFLGAEISEAVQEDILHNLDFDVSLEGKSWKVTPPSFRADIQREVDVIEEIARVIGYDKLSYSVPPIVTGRMQTNQQRRQRANVREHMVAQGCNEIITYTMIGKEFLKKSLQVSLEGTTVVNPLTVDQEILRPSLFPSLLNIAHFNINRGERNLKLFETGKVYLAGQEKERLAVLIFGERTNDWRLMKKSQQDFFDIKGAIEYLLNKLRIKEYHFELLEADYFDDVGAALYIDGVKAGEVGCVSDKVLDNWSIKQKGLFYAEIDLDMLYAAMAPKERFVPLSEYPSVVWDISLAVDLEIAFDQVQKIAFEFGGDLLKSVEFKEEYVGEKIEKGKRGIIFSLTYQSSEKTLTEAEVSEVHDRICQALIEQLRAVKR